MISKTFDVKKNRELESQAGNLGLPEVILIENASSNLFTIIHGLDLGRKALVISGGGNNGADVLSCARKLASRGYKAVAVIVRERELREQVLFQKRILERIKIPVYLIDSVEQIGMFENLLREADFIVDGILGIGIKGEVSPFLSRIITTVNQSGKKVVACDIPSGLSPDEGRVLGAAIRADYTVTFIAAKPGFFLKEGPGLCGEIFVADIGISAELIEKSAQSNHV